MAYDVAYQDLGPDVLCMRGERVDETEPTPPLEGPFTRIAGVTGAIQLVVMLAGLLLPSVRLVLGVLLVGVAIGVATTCLPLLLSASARRVTPRISLAAGAFSAACGAVLLLAPFYLGPPSPGRDGGGEAQTTPATSLAGGGAPTASPAASGIPAPSQASAGPAPASADLFLDRLPDDRVRQYGACLEGGVQRGSADLAGTTFPESVYSDRVGCGSAELTLPAGYRSFLATIGVTAGQAEMQLFSGQVRLLDRTVDSTDRLVNVVCDIGASPLLSFEMQRPGNGLQTEVWGGARVSTTPAPRAHQCVVSPAL
jgi:hypothetical protein